VGPRVNYAPTRDGGSVAYTVAGKGPLLVWCQPFSHQQFDWQDERMAAFYGELARSHTLVRYDMRGFAMSGLDGRTMSLDLLLADLEAVIEASAGSAVDLAGVSGLGLVAIAYAASHPESIRRLVLWGTPRRGVQFREGPRVRSMRAVVDIDSDLALELQARWVFGHERVGERQLAHARAVFGAGTNEAYVDVLWRTQLEPQLSVLTVPTLVMQPTGESLISVEHARDLASAIRGSEFVLVDGDYYPYQAANCHQLVQMINDFLGTGSPVPALTSGTDLTPEALSQREAEVLGLLASGHTNAEIAQALVLSPRTVEQHVRNIYTKLNFHNRVEAANWAREHGVAG
jgi:DNA-binding CsgD family transcriptional regulator/pimeloyl-ACP methyl ester carboxylesterase